jgi:hypothetical protein
MEGGLSPLGNFGGTSMEESDNEAKFEIRERWYEDDGSVIIYRHQIVPRRWWNHLTRPLGVVAIMFAVAWPILLLAYGWSKLGVASLIGDISVVYVGLELISCGAKRWNDT